VRRIAATQDRLFVKTVVYPNEVAHEPLAMDVVDEGAATQLKSDTG
jgi:hypothetical protein